MKKGRPGNLFLLFLLPLFILIFISSCSPTTETLMATTTQSPTITNTISLPNPSTNTPQPTTSPPIVTNIPELPTTFSLSSANMTIPSDVLQEVGYFVGGGGPSCSKWEYDNNGIGIGAPEDGELMTVALFFVCGWQSEETVQATIEFPDGRTISREINSFSYNNDGFYEVWFWFVPFVTDPVGEYKFTLRGKSDSVERSAYYESPSGPHLYYYDSQTELSWSEIGNRQKTEINKLLIYGFKPNEYVRLFAYKEKGDTISLEFYAWNQYQVDSNGQLLIDVDIDTRHFVAIGEITGQVAVSRYGPYGKLSPLIYSSIYKTNKGDIQSDGKECPGAPPQRVDVGDKAWVCTKSDFLIMRKKPKRSGAEIIRLAPRTSFTIIDGPSCANNWSYWEIITDDGVEGWVSEGGDKIDPYFICPDK